MTGTRPLLVGVLALATLALAGCGGGGGSSSSSSSSSTTSTSSTTTSASGMTLDGVVGPGFTISLTQNGQPVSTLSAGTYTVNVDDKSDLHNFHLLGPGVDKATDVSGTGTDTWTVTLKKGSYTFQCDPHVSTMHGSFTVS